MSSSDKLPKILNSSLSDTHLKPIQSLQKYSNSTLFERREMELKENQLKKSELASQLYQQITKHQLQSKSSLYLTDNVKLRKHQSENIQSLSKNTKEGSLTSSSNANANTNQGLITQESPLYLLNAILSERKLSTAQPKSDIFSSLDKKIKAMRNGKLPNIQDFINKTRDIVLLKYTSNIKKERAIRLKETYENEIQAIKEKVASLEDARQLFNENFFQKFGEYVKYLGVKKEEEKEIDNGLIEKINELKGQIMVLESKTKKIQADKAGLDRWMYFQIKVKEKKKALPTYYQLILDDYSEEMIASVFEKEYQTKVPFIKGIKKMMKKILSKKIDSQPTSTKLNANQGGINSNVGVTQSTLNEFNAKKESLGKEKERILIYKSNPVYRTAEDFEQELKRYENENLKYINEYNAKSAQLVELQQDKETLFNELIKEDRILDLSISIREKQLNMIKERYKKLLVEYALYKDSSKDKRGSTISIVKGLMQHRSQADIKKSIKNRIVHSKLYNKINELLITSKQSMLVPIEEPIKKTLEPNDELEMMNMLKFIEKTLVILVDLYKQYSKKREKELKEIENQIEKYHKQRKSEQVKEIERHRLDILKKKIEERNNKIYVLPIKKMDLCYSRLAKKGKQNQDNKTYGDLKFEDFMFDVLDN